MDPEGSDGKPISLFESGAILVYLASKTGRFMPKSDRGKLSERPAVRRGAKVLAHLRRPITGDKERDVLFGKTHHESGDRAWLFNLPGLAEIEIRIRPPNSSVRGFQLQRERRTLLRCKQAMPYAPGFGHSQEWMTQDCVADGTMKLEAKTTAFLPSPEAVTDDQPR